MSITRYARLRDDGRVEFAPKGATQEQLTEGGYLPYEEQEKPTGEHNYATEYAQKDGKIIRGWKPYPNYERIAELKEQLTATDYKVIKCNEVQLVGGDMPYDITALHTERQAIRDEINRLERCEDNE